MNQKMIEPAFLSGPFVGELEWEMFYFVPYILHLKKLYPKNHLISFTRPERFDLYGQYASYLVPLRINESGVSQNGFGLNGFDVLKYKRLAILLKIKYQDQYKIKAHIYPRIDNYRNLVKWQFPRHNTYYKFEPRIANKDLLKEYINLNKPLIFIDLSWTYNEKEKLLIIETLKPLKNCEIVVYDDNKLDYNNIVNICNIPVDNITITTLGMSIYAIKNSMFSIGNISSTISKLSLLLEIPLVIFEDSYIDPLDLSLINPLNTQLITILNIKDLEKLYANSF